MSVDQKKTLSRIRTFAQDLQQQRKQGGAATPTPQSTATKTPPPVVSVPLPPKTPAPQPQPTTEQLPAFHELQRKVQVQIEKRASSITHTANTTPAFQKGPAIVSEPVHTPAPTPKKVLVRPKKVEHRPISSDVTIITDTKRNEFKLFPSLVTSIKAWVHSFAIATKRKETPKYTVAQTDRRKGVIQKATSKTGTIFTADNETLKEEIRRRKPHTFTKEIPKEADEPEILWSPNTESGYALLEEPEPVVESQPTNVQVEYKKQPVPPPIFVEPTMPPPMVAPEPVAEPIQAPVITVTVPSTPPIAAAPVTPPPAQAEPVIEPAATPTLPPEEVLNDTDRSPASPRFSLPNLNTNLLTLSVIGIVGAGALIFVIVRIIISLTVPATTIINTPPATHIIEAATTVDLVLPSLTESALTESIMTAQANATNITEVRFTDQAGIPIETSDLLSLFGFRSNPNLNQSITDVRLLVLRSGTAVIFTVTDPATTFGSLLAWEPTMAADVSALLNIPELSTTNRFTDQTIGSIDIRILMSGEKQVLVYGFIDENTVVIAPHTGIFAEIIGSNQ